MTYDLTLEPNLSLGPILEIDGISINFKPNRTNSDNYQIANLLSAQS
jgi:hypothetical protein